MSARDSDPLLIPCPACETTIRVPRDRLEDSPKCPRCKMAVLSDRPVVVDQGNFPRLVESGDLPVLVDFWAAWCGPCRMMAPVLDRAASQWATRLRIAKLDTDANQALAARFAVRSIPTLILFRNGREIARQSGALDLGSLGRWLESALR